jgi:hypothetical protein
MFAYHPLLMVCGFLGAQIVAISDWSILRSHRVAKCVHVLVQTTGLGCLSVGLYVVVDLNLKAKMPALTTLHSWMGIAATSVFTVNYVLGGFSVFILTVRKLNVCCFCRLVHGHRDCLLSALHFETSPGHETHTQGAGSDLSRSVGAGGGQWGYGQTA